MEVVEDSSNQRCLDFAGCEVYEVLGAASARILRVLRLGKPALLRSYVHADG